MKKQQRPLLLSISVGALAFQVAATVEASAVAVLPTLQVEAMEENDPTRTYIDYQQASVTRNGLDKKQIPQTIDTLDVQKYKLYGSNDLSVMLQGTPGVSTTYDMRGDGITLRGFGADTSDIYRDGIRESGQVRRSTANIERIEILKGPASVLYGRTGGGGVINMVSKTANFESRSSIGAYAGSYDNQGLVVDVNELLSDHWAVRVTGEKGSSDSFRRGIESDIKMLSPSITYDSYDGLTWTAQYTYDKLSRVPDRGPAFSSLPAGTSRSMGFAQPGDFVDDELQVLRSDLRYQLNDQWQLGWMASYREAYQNFDHFYLGSLCVNNTGPCAGRVGQIRQIYFWQETLNTTLSNNVTLTGDVMAAGLRHRITLGFDYSQEQREPKLSNRNKDGSAIFGYVDPLTGQRESSRGTGEREITTHNYAKGTNYGLFAQNLIGITDRLDLMLGLRYDVYQSKSENRLLPASSANFSREVDDATWSPNVGIVWRPVDDHSLYASYSRSFAPFGGRVGVNPVSANENLAIFNAEPQYNDQYEVGIKSDLLQGRLSTQFALFDIRKNNIRYRPDPDNDPFYWEVQGQHQSRGVELSFIGQLADQWYIRGGYGYNEARVKEDKSRPENTDKYLPSVAKQTGNLFLRYLPTDAAYAEIGVTHVGDSWTSLANTQQLKGFDRVDAALGYNLDNWRMSLAVSNLLDKEYWRSTSMPGTPRSLLFRVNYVFE